MVAAATKANVAVALLERKTAGSLRINYAHFCLAVVEDSPNFTEVSAT